MSGRRFGESRDVRIAEFLYRHEAEFAAGFLSDADIPFRLQADDAGGADVGVTISRPAALWVRAEDVEEAREILGLDEPSPDPAPRPVRSSHRRRGPSLHVDDTPELGVMVTLRTVERLIAGLLAVVTLAVGALGPGPSDGVAGAVWLGATVAVAGLLGESALFGRTLRPLKALLGALSGEAP